MARRSDVTEKRLLQSDRLQQRMGYWFRESRWLEMALTHRSIEGRPSNERLEFLGDSLLNFFLGEALFSALPDAQEGELTRLRARFACEETAAAVARSLELGSVLQLGIGELKSGGCERKSILADALEALIAAIYLDAGWDTAKERVLAWYGDRLATAPQLRFEKDPKTTLQECLQSKGLPLPSYTVLGVAGQAHQQIFEVVCEVSALSLMARATASSRRQAEQQAAAIVLQQIQT